MSQVQFEEILERPCPNCNSSNQANVFAESNIDLSKLDQFAFASRKLPEYMHHRLVTCPKCDLLYASPIPSLQEVAEAYHVAAFDSTEEAGFASQTYGQVLASFIKNLPDLISALDIGTGDGIFLKQLLKAGFSQVSGVEPSLAPIEAAEPAIKPLIKQGLFAESDYTLGSYSLISCFQTLEHLYDPQEMCKAVYNLLKPGGAVFLICHNRRAFSARLLGTKSPIFDIEHLQLFSPLSVHYLLEQSGFRNIEVKHIYNCYPLHYWVKLFPIPNKVKQPLIKWLKKLKVGYLPVSLPAGNLAAVGYR